MLNGASEVAMDAFLRENPLARCVVESVQAMPVITHPTLEQLFKCDRAAQQAAALWRASAPAQEVLTFHVTVLALLLLGVADYRA
ncbi:MAG: hypothetical protein ACLUI3_03065 [Christensenellales bacterium]